MTTTTTGWRTIAALSLSALAFGTVGAAGFDSLALAQPAFADASTLVERADLASTLVERAERVETSNTVVERADLASTLVERAERVETSFAANANPALIDADRTGQLTIHKYVGAPLDQAANPANGTEITPAGATPLAGVKFTATRVNGVDLTTNEGWTQALAYSNNLALAQQNLGQTFTSAPTDASGVAVLGDLPLGLYLVHEVPGDPSLTPAGDFLVTVPMTNPNTRTDWLYDIHVYPKNSRTAITKAVVDGNAGQAGGDASVAGKVLTYELRGDIPVTGLDAADATYVIRDTLDAQAAPYLEFLAADWAGKVAVTIPEVQKSLKPCAGATTGCDYTLTQTADRVEVALTPEGLLAMRDARAANPDAKVHVTIEARVKASINAATSLNTDALDACGKPNVLQLANTAVLFPSKPALDANTGVPSNQVVTKYAALRLHKIEFGSQANLAGAVFTLYRTQADAKAGTNPLAVSQPTDAKGLTQFAGLHVTDFQNDRGDNDSYWIVETGVPAGYRALPGPVEVKLLADGTTFGADASCALPMPNEPLKPGEPTPRVPTTLPTVPGQPGQPGNPVQWVKDTLAKTGAEVGPVTILALLLLVGGGIAFVLIGRRRTEGNES